MSVSDYLDPDEMIEENERDTEGDSDVMGVTEDSPGYYFIRASSLLDCEWCGNTAIHPSQVTAVRPRDHSVMMCEKCMPKPSIPEEWL